ncbi:dhhc zinc finger domain containing protein [Stylonychia lemnae]|uniref:Palmitoyltransferase n=1 Tax=Stylonychia lemnae TaxID=5949 RepID=A0A078A0C5_STYLE|nr:dhhc zinc finger domain containing protein [Stylonychia lemnae]|eukprot:CDW75651.1 dhhc zinc finger domain containing protein [Stylonychia lemnae]
MAHSPNHISYDPKSSDQKVHSNTQNNKKNHAMSVDQDLNQPLINKSSQNTQHKKSNFKHESFKQSASVNEVDSFDSNTFVSGLGVQNSGMRAEDADVFLDDSAFSQKNSQAYESLKKIKKSRQDQMKMREVSEKAFQLIETRDKMGLMRFLDQNQTVPIIDLVDARGYTLLHMICFKNIEDLIYPLMEKVQQIYTQTQIKLWINYKTEEDGFTALHFGSFRGNINIIKLLLENGADMHMRNNFGINVLHVAAQGDQPISLYYFKEKGIDITSKDNRNSTPMHWACYSRSEIALCYLLSWVKDLDEQDIEGFTPLHLAVKSVEQLRSTRPVRSLLIRGSSRNARDKQGRKPVDLVDQISIPSLQQELRSMLKEPKGCTCFMIKTPLKLMRKSASTPTFFLGLILINYILLFLFVLPLTTAAFVMAILFFMLSQGVDPGYLRKPQNITFLSMLQTFDPVLLCPDCEVIRTTRSRHCSICNRCVERFDHHCPWVNNCVGIKNHHFFMMFLVSITLVLLSVLVTVSVTLNEFNEELISENFLILLPRDTYNKNLFYFGAIINLITSAFFLLPVMLLTLIQLRNFCVNKTTNERFARRVSTSQSESASRTSSMASSVNNTTLDDSMISQQLSRGGPCGFLSNCSQMCFNHQMVDQSKLFNEQMQIVNPQYSSQHKVINDSIEEDLTQSYDQKQAINYSKSSDESTSRSRL